jgi:hypothetical protein
MDVALIEMPAEVAAEELKKYRRSLHRRADAEYSAIANGLEALAEGTPLISLSRAFTDVPRDDRGRPRLAIARADRMRCMYRGRGGLPMTFDSGYDHRGGGNLRDVFLEVQGTISGHVDGYALVPIVPPEARAGHSDLQNYFILWEVERWADNARAVGPDIDPFLLQRISVDLYAVVAQWDLSPLEQAVLAGRRFA